MDSLGVRTVSQCEHIADQREMASMKQALVPIGELYSDCKGSTSFTQLVQDSASRANKGKLPSCARRGHRWHCGLGHVPRISGACRIFLCLIGESRGSESS